MSTLERFLSVSKAQVVEQTFARIVRVPLVYRQRMIWRMRYFIIRVVHVIGIVDNSAYVASRAKSNWL